MGAVGRAVFEGPYEEFDSVAVLAAGYDSDFFW
jgi:hypothetical protein